MKIQIIMTTATHTKQRMYRPGNMRTNMIIKIKAVESALIIPVSIVISKVVYIVICYSSYKESKGSESYEQ